MGRSDFCSAVYKRKFTVTSQSKFVQAVFKAAGSGEFISDDYARKMFSGVKPISEPQYESFPEPIDRDGLRTFLSEYVSPSVSSMGTTQEWCQQIARNAGLPSSLAVETEPFPWALTDRFEAIIHDRDHCDTLERAYRLRLGGSEPQQLQGRPEPLYKDDRVHVIHPPAVQNHEVAFWSNFTHERVLKTSEASRGLDALTCALSRRVSTSARAKLPKSPSPMPNLRGSSSSWGVNSSPGVKRVTA